MTWTGFDARRRRRRQRGRNRRTGTNPIGMAAVPRRSRPEPAWPARVEAHRKPCGLCELCGGLGCRRRAVRVELRPMRLREVKVGCIGGGTGLPSLLGGLKSNPWLQVNAVVTMFDSGGSSGVLRDQLGVLPPGRHPEVRAGARPQRAGSAARAAVAPADARARPPGRPHRRQPAAVDDGALQRRLPRGRGRPARAARVPRPRLAGQRRALVHLRGVLGRLEHARRGGGGRTAARGAVGPAALARSARPHPPRRSPTPSASSTSRSSAPAASSPA